MLDELYNPPDPQPPPKPDWSARTYLILAVVVALISPLLCVAGVWWGVQKRFQEAGLL
jgi:hypothetical protein